MFQPLEDVIRNSLIPSLCGRQVSDIERRMLALPYRYGGLGIRNPVAVCDGEYAASRQITQQLADLIVEQETDISRLDRERMADQKKERKQKKNNLEEIMAGMDAKSVRLFRATQEKGASAWLSAMPIKRLGYTVNNQEFRDGVCLRYGWRVENMPSICGCGS